VSRDRLEKDVGRITEDFLAKLAKTLSNQKEREYSVEEIEDQIKGITSVLSVLSQRWSLEIIFLLYMKSLKFNELRELLHGISSRTLTDKLRMLERNGILTRNIVSNAPVRVGYSLTSRGREVALSCLPLLYQIRKLK
jgi:DNA-binding HxlR family transcriptional regulator